MNLKEAKCLVGRYICVKIEHAPEDAKRLGRRFEEICGEVIRVEQDSGHPWLVFDWGISVRLDGIVEWWEEASE